jgi:hypothetical protein
MVDGNANYRDGSGRQGRIAYHCTMHPNMADSSYKVTGGNSIRRHRSRAKSSIVRGGGPHT